MGEIRSLKKEEWDSYQITKTDWDLEIRHRPYCVISIDDKDYQPICHSLGGNIGENNYYAYPLFREVSCKNCEDSELHIDYDIEPTIDTLIEFCGEAPVWGIQFTNTNYFKKNEIRSGSKGIITRNGKPFYEFGGSDMGYALSNAQYFISQLRNHPCWFNQRNWQQNLMGRKIWYGVDPAIVKGIIEDQGCVILHPDKKYISHFRVQPWMVGDDGNIIGNDGNSAKCEYLYDKINWHRSDEQTEHFMRLSKPDLHNFLSYANQLSRCGQLTQEGYLELLKIGFQKV